MPLGRGILRDLAEQRLAEARTLLRTGHHLGAFYLAGYAAELGLKACIAALFRSDEIPDWPNFRDLRTHDLTLLVQRAGLVSQLEARLAEQEFDESWQMVKRWKPDSRYETDIDAELAASLIRALISEPNGVMPWIRQHW